MTKVWFITGSSRGLGKSLTEAVLAHGDRVAATARKPEQLKDLVDQYPNQVLPLALDVTDKKQIHTAVAAAIDHFGRIDVLVNNAAVFEPFLIAEASDAQLVSTVTTNLLGAMLCVRAAVPLMGRGGHILNVTSESVGMTYPFLVAYQSSKAGLERFSEGLYHELDPQGIRVTNVRCGQMFEEGKTWDIAPEMRMRFGMAAMAAGINLRERPLSQFTSVVEAFRHLLDLPADLHAANVSLHARKP